MDIFWKISPLVKDLPDFCQPIIAPIQTFGGNINKKVSDEPLVLVADVKGFVTIPYFRSELDSKEDQFSEFEQALVNDLTVYFRDTFIGPAANYLVEYRSNSGELSDNWVNFVKNQQSFASLVIQEMTGLVNSNDKDNLAYFGVGNMQTGQIISAVITNVSELESGINEVISEIGG